MPPQPRADRFRSRHLLPTKLYPPKLDDGTIPRPRLMAFLDKDSRQELTLITAPAGFGKTTLVAQWLMHKLGTDEHPWPQEAAWLSLDSGDNDLRRFLIHLVGAFRLSGHASCDETTALLHAPVPAPPAYVEDVLFSELSSSPLAQLYLVLDDCHQVQNSEVWDFLMALIQRGPRWLKPVLISRIDVPLQLSRMRLSNAQVEVRARDLRFTNDEIRAFLAQESAEMPGEEEIAQLEQVSEGWIALLKMSVIAARHRKDQLTTEDMAQQFSEYRASYLVEEVINRQPPSVRNFLLKTSVLDRFTPPLCDFLLGEDAGRGVSEELPGQCSSPSAATIQQLEAGRVFLVPLDDGHQWFRYHHLFAALLKQQLVQVLGQNAVHQLQARAGAWFGSQGMWDDALRYALAAGDMTRAADIVSEQSQILMEQDEPQVLQRWLASLPEEIIHSRPELLLAQASLLQVTARADTNVAILDEAERLLDASEEDPATLRLGSVFSNAGLRAAIAALRVLSSNVHGDYELSAAQARAALAELNPERTWLHSTAYIGGTVSRQMLGQGPETIQEVQDELRHNRSHAPSLLGPWMALCVLYLMNGYSQDLVEAGQIFLQNAQAENRRLMVVWAHYLLGMGYYEQHDLANALIHFEAGAALKHQVAHMPVRDCMLGRAFVNASLGRKNEALKSLREVSQFAQEISSAHMLSRLRSAHVRIGLILGDAAYSSQQLGESVDESRRHGLNEIETPLHTVAWVRLVRGTPESLAEGDRLLQEMRQMAARTYNMRWLLDAQALHSVVLAAGGDKPAALALLRETVEMARPRGWLRSFVELGPAMAGLLAELAIVTPNDLFVSGLLSMMDTTSLTDSTGTHRNGRGSNADRLNDLTPMVEELTPRELQVLTLLALDYSYEAVARALIITPNTVKKHAANIYSKLGVRRRSQAVSRARGIGLLPHE